MSNPAVVQLASTYIGNMEVRIEDNWAESIHLHMGMLRIDLTVNEFLDIANKMESAAQEIIDAENFNISEFDPIFLNFYSSTLIDLERIEMDKVKLGDLIILKNVKLPKYCHLDQSRDYKALTGDYEELNAYKSQVNMIGESNIERLNKMLESIQKNGYPYNGEYIVLRNDQNVLLDGQHRASCLYYLYGPDYEIPVMRFHFTNKKYNITDWHPWRRGLYRKVIDFLKGISHRISGSGNIDI